jgi:hypothetical protein
MNRIEKDPLQSRIEITNWAVLATLTLISWLFMSHAFVLGILSGGLISIINFHWLYRDLTKVFRNLSDGAKSAIMFKYYIRFIVTGIVIFFVITRTDANVIGLVVGLSLVVLNILLNAFINVLLSKKNCLEEVK